MKETIRRAFRTFVQTATGYIVTNIAILSDPETLQNTDILKTTIIGLIISAISAGLAAVMNLPKKGWKMWVNTLPKYAIFVKWRLD